MLRVFLFHPIIFFCDCHKKGSDLTVSSETLFLSNVLLSRGKKFETKNGISFLQKKKNA
jgi:hypothetical protein